PTSARSGGATGSTTRHCSARASSVRWRAISRWQTTRRWCCSTRTARSCGAAKATTRGSCRSWSSRFASAWTGADCLAPLSPEYRGEGEHLEYCRQHQASIPQQPGAIFRRHLVPLDDRFQARRHALHQLALLVRQRELLLSIQHASHQRMNRLDLFDVEQVRLRVPLRRLVGVGQLLRHVADEERVAAQLLVIDAVRRVRWLVVVGVLAGAEEQKRHLAVAERP